MGFLNNIFKRSAKETKQFPPIPAWRPNTPIDHDEILEMARYYTGDKLQLGVFNYGTVAIFPGRVSDIERESKSVINKIYNAHPDFKPISMDDGNFLIEYIQPAFTIVFQKELDEFWDYIEKNHLNGICTDEVLINTPGECNVFDRIGKISLYGRAKMFMDAQNPEILKTFDPQFRT